LPVLCIVTFIIAVLKWFLGSLLVRTSACRKDVRGSIPSQGEHFFKTKKLRVVAVPHGDDPQLILVSRRKVDIKRLRVVAVPHGDDPQLTSVRQSVFGAEFDLLKIVANKWQKRLTNKFTNIKVEKGKQFDQKKIGKNSSQEKRQKNTHTILIKFGK
jgi:hypothetical protein